MSADDDELADLVVDGRYGRPHEHHATLASTNDRALGWAQAAAPHGALVTADAQTAGRGRRGRTWHSPPGQHVYASVVLRPRRPGPSLGPLALAAGVGLSQGLATLGVEVGLKWPNDVLLAGRKLAGILCEARWTGTTPEVVVGFGLNVHAERFDGSLADVATSLRMHGLEVGRAAVLRALLTGLEPALEAFFAHGWSSLAAAYEARSVVLGRTIEVDGEGEHGPRRGVAERLDEDGALWIRPPGAPPFAVRTADVWLTPQ